jgi:hypothetical protein
MKTRYIYTAKAEEIARSCNLKEYRKAGTAASFAYQPLENSPVTAHAWLDDGIIEEAPEPVNFLTFTFNTTAANAMTRLFKANNIRFHENLYFEICADIDGTGQLVRVDYFNIGHDPETGLNLFEIVEKPRRTAEFFNMTGDELYADTGDGWTKEDCLLADLHPEAKPWTATLKDAIEKAKDLKTIYTDRNVEILQTISNKYAVVVY